MLGGTWGAIGRDSEGNSLLMTNTQCIQAAPLEAIQLKNCQCNIGGDKLITAFYYSLQTDMRELISSFVRPNLIFWVCEEIVLGLSGCERVMEWPRPVNGPLQPPNSIARVQRLIGLRPIYTTNNMPSP